ncbi:MAG: phenylalanine--tRNA ligase subunit beta [Candidatus Marinimicrobia bacterium]|nr:phenylalanine--tRNA ligase subunit beta [Candidatus Neomarinimicrobiota bacterium]
MIINTKWLEKYTEVPFSPTELEDRLTSLGLESAVRKSPVDGLKGVIVAEVLDVQRHPNADRLSVCRVNTGADELSIVCGAPNVAKGQKVALAILGTTLPNGITLKPTKIRGVSSDGMICAEDELGISDNHIGIMVLDSDAPIGMKLSEYLEQNGKTMDVDLTPNRPDCASHIGIAREVTLLTGKELHIPAARIAESDEPVGKYIDVEIENTVGCPRYAARVIRGVRIAPSPIWLAKALEGIGLRSINNVVDAANFVLMETGHPLHTFDYRNIHGKKIVVRSAAESEIVTTLDGSERKLSRNVLLICDAERPVAVAGIMGLANSEITPETTDVLIESAYFDPGTIRKGSKYLGLQTDASYRFERGADPEGVIYALNRLTSLIVEVAGGKICRGIVDRYPAPVSRNEIVVRFKRIYSLLDIHIDPAWIRQLFEKLGVRIISADPEKIVLISPSFRPDLTREVDYIEEVVRVYGMSKIPSARRLQIQPIVDVQTWHDIVEKLRSTICSYGYDEVFNNSLVCEKWTTFGMHPAQPIKLKNPLSQEMAYMRNSLVPGMIGAAKRNINRKNGNLKLFEIGYIQEFDPKSETSAKETQKLSVLISGELEDKHWAHSSTNSDIFILKGVVEDIVARFGFSTIKFVPEKNEYFSHLICVIADERDFGYISEIDPGYLKKDWDIEVPVFVMELNVSVLTDIVHPAVKYHELPVYPSIERDVSIWVPEKLSVGETTETIRKNGGDHLREVRFYDLYSGKSVDKLKKSFTFNLVFQANDRTLKDEEVDKAMTAIHNALTNELNAKLR